VEKDHDWRLSEALTLAEIHYREREKLEGREYSRMLLDQWNDMVTLARKLEKHLSAIRQLVDLQRQNNIPMIDNLGALQLALIDLHGAIWK
jgi:hypothetical protein